MKSAIYKQRKNKLVCGVCAGIADKFGWDLPLTRVLTVLLIADVFLWLWHCHLYSLSNFSSLQRRYHSRPLRNGTTPT